MAGLALAASSSWEVNGPLAKLDSDGVSFSKTQPISLAIRKEILSSKYLKKSSCGAAFPDTDE